MFNVKCISVCPSALNAVSKESYYELGSRPDVCICPLPVGLPRLSEHGRVGFEEGMELMPWF
jgi:hypothetical protein